MTSVFIKILAWIFIVFGFLFSVVFTVEALSDSSIDKSIATNREIEAAFHAAGNFVDSFKKEKQHDPLQNELNDFLKSQKSEFAETIYLNSDLGNRPPFLSEAPPGSYYLTYWHGEWADYYAGWSKQSNLGFDKEAYYPFDSKKLTILAGCLSLLAMVFGFFLKKKNHT